ncbi:MAG: polysaccharide biosynthesis tyrosine autokinase [Rubricoccaceae bacterium]
MRRRFIIGSVFLLALLLTLAYTFTRVPVYQTSAIVSVDFSQIPGQGGVRVEEDSPFIRSDRTIATELFILNNSRSIGERVTARLEQEMGARPPGSVSFDAERSVPNVVRITATSSDPKAAAALANAYAEEYVRQTQLDSRAFLTGAVEFLEEQRDMLRGELTAAENALQRFQESTGAAVTAGGGAAAGRLAGLEAERDNARIEMQTREATLRTIEAELAAINPRLADRLSSPVDRRIQVVQQQIAALEQERQLAAGYETAVGRDAAERPDVQRIDRQIATLQAELEQLTNRYLEEVRAAGGALTGEQGAAYVNELQRRRIQEQIALNGMRERAASAAQRIRAAEAELARVPAQTIGVARLERERLYRERMYDYVQERLREMQIAEATQTGYARLMRAAAEPSVAVGPDRTKNLGFGLLFGLLLGLGLAFARDRFDTRVYKPDHLTDRGLYVLEAVPDLSPLIKEEFDGAATVRYQDRDVATSLVTMLAPLAPPSETYRHLRTSVQFSRPGVLVETILVTSAGAGEGKSTTAANLAITMAQAGRRTLLIDADLRRPRQHDLFGLPRDTGLAQILAVGDTSPDALRQWMEMFRIPGEHPLYVLPTGGEASSPADDAKPSPWRIENPAELLGSPRMREVLRQYRRMFDVVVIDSPPVLAATDAVLLSTQADATVVVTCAGKTKGADIEQALDHLADVGAHVVGGILNRFTLSDAFGYAYSYGHYSRYGPYSTYGYTSKKKRKSKRRPTASVEKA